MTLSSPMMSTQPFATQLKGVFAGRLNATGVIVKIPCPKNTTSCKIIVGAGKAKYEPEHQVCFLPNSSLTNYNVHSNRYLTSFCVSFTINPKDIVLLKSI